MTRMEGGETINEGLCLQCAKELGIKPVNDLVEKMGISEEELESMNSQLLDVMDNDGDDMFEMGGAQPFPFLSSIFGDLPTKQEHEREKNTQREKKEKKEKEKKRKYLDSYCENLSKKAADGKIDNIIGRDKEIYRVIQILNRRTKNNPCLIGEPGVGKTAIAEGIALRLASGNVPSRMLDKQLYLLDLTALVAGTQFRGQFESRVKGLVEDIKAEGNVILFIDEVHNLVGAGDSEGSMNAANILKPALSRGEIQVIGATTFAEYRKHIEKDAALERRFQPVTINEPSIADSIDVIMGIKRYYEQYHRVLVSDDVAKSAVVLSERYITDRFLPDKAIDLLDEACSCASLKNKALTEYDSFKKQLEKLSSEEAEIKQNADNINYERIAEIKAETLRLDAKIKELEPEALNTRVTEADLAAVIELWTGIPASKIRETELKKVANLSAALSKKIIGQQEAVELVSAAVKRSRIQISGRRRPASFIFVGPTGVGKTELVKVLASELFDTTEPLIRVDMSEYMEKHAVSKLVGSPPGYVGYDEAGQLTEKVRRKPYSVVLFDEIEKAHPDVMNILLQILDEGRITDAHGRVVSFENTVIVMTSNAGSERKDSNLGFNRQPEQIARDRAYKSLSEFLRPEFIARVDEIVVFQPLTKENYEQIAALMLDEYKAPLQEKYIKFDYDEQALKLIAEKSYGKKSGARDIRNYIRKEVEDKICTLLIDNADSYPALLKLTAEGDNLKILTA